MNEMISEGEDGRIGEQGWFGDSSVFGLPLTAFLFPGHFSSPSQVTATVFLCGADSSPGFRFDVHPLRHLWPLSGLVIAFLPFQLIEISWSPDWPTGLVDNERL